jgi:hypothetical protein
VREGVAEQWRWLLAVEAVVAEVRDAFGEDPLLPRIRWLLDHVRTELEGVHEQAERFLGPLALPEQNEEALAKVRELALGDDA